jgi:hypothetical protein
MISSLERKIAYDKKMLDFNHDRRAKKNAYIKCKPRTVQGIGLRQLMQRKGGADVMM